MTLKQFSFILVLVIAWKALRTDWIVECEAAAADFHPPVSVEHYTATFTPSPTPFWHPPSAAEITGRPSATWSDSEFFAAGGSYGPTSPPRLRIRWERVLAEGAGAFFLAWIVFSVRSERRTTPPLVQSHENVA